jgi:hypothetical protein
MSSLISKLAYGLVCAGLGAGAALLFADGHREPPKKEPEAKTQKDSGPVRRQLINSRSRALEIEQLQALGYVDGTYDPQSELADVVTNVKNKTSPGYNFYASRKQNGARLIDMDGRAVYEWSTREKGAWQHVELMPNGDVFVIVKDQRLARYDKDSNRVWTVRGRFHHDLWMFEGQIYVLSRAPRIVPAIHPSVPTLVDVIQVRSPDDGSLIREISIFDAIAKSPYGFLLPSIAQESRSAKKGYLDVLHTNHVEVFDGALADRHPMYSKGNILISMRNINAIAILDGDTSEVVWIWGPTNLTFQHHPALLRNGNILLFDNGLKRSRVIEINPLSRRVEWQYAPRSGFYSQNRGSIQRLPNGNTLITESDRGYVIEVTPKKQVVWKFANPIVNKKKEREAIWRMKRFAPGSLTFLN